MTNNVKIPVFHFFEKVNEGKMLMSTIKNDQTLLYCHFNKIMKGSGTSFQSQALTQKHTRNVCYTA